MDRLIYKEADGDLTCRSRDFDKVFPTLYAYEDSGLTPEQAKNLGANLDAMKELAQDLSDKLEQARKELEVKDLQLHLMADERNIAQKERDAAVTDINNARPCFACKNFRRNGGSCGGGMRCVDEIIRSEAEGKEYTGPEWEWRGAEDINVPGKQEG